MQKPYSHIYWFAYYTMESPSVRYRGKYFLDYVKNTHNIPYSLIIPSYRIQPFCQFLVTFLRLLFLRPKNSLIVIQRVQSHFIYALLLKIVVRIRSDDTVYDIDDADYLLGNPKTIHFFIKHCRWVAAGSEEILRYVKPMNPRCLHLSSPTSDLGIKKIARNKKTHIGWIGDYFGDHKKGLKQLLFPALMQLNYPIRFSMTGVKYERDKIEIQQLFSDHPSIELCFIQIDDWSDERKIQRKICQMDIGIATLLPTPIQLAKSGIKVKQYLNNGVPVISSDLPENARFIVNGQNGFLADSAQDFAYYLKRMEGFDINRYQQMSEAAYASRDNFSHEVFFTRLKELTLRLPFPLKLIKNHSNKRNKAISN